MSSTQKTPPAVDPLEGGYVKLYRKIIESRVFKNPELLKVWVWCLSRARRFEGWVPIKTGKGCTEVFLKPGQFIYGRYTAAEALDMPESSVRNRMELLEKIGNLDIKPDNQYSIVSILKWDIYQGGEPEKGQAKGQPKDNQRTTKGQPKDTNKNLKNDKNDKNNLLKGRAARGPAPAPAENKIFLSFKTKGTSQSYPLYERDVLELEKRLGDSTRDTLREIKRILDEDPACRESYKDTPAFILEQAQLWIDGREQAQRWREKAGQPKGTNKNIKNEKKR